MGLFIVKNVASCIVNLLIFKMLPILRGAVIGLTRSQLNSHPAEEDKPLKTSYLNIFMLVCFFIHCGPYFPSFLYAWYLGVGYFQILKHIRKP